MVDLKQIALQHLRWFIAHAPMRGFGPHDGPLWMSSLDLISGKALGPERPPGIVKRCYRLIESPWGSNLYWDLPLIAACHLASETSGDSAYAESADAYAREYIARCRSSSGLFWWANHYYFDARSGSVVFFKEDNTGAFGPVPVAADDPCRYHETRPLRVPWELLWKINPDAVRDSIYAQSVEHLVDSATGEFNRHADRKAEHPFLEAGGILAESLCWLGVRLPDHQLIDLAERVLRFNFNAADRSTGLMPVSPRYIRWDYFTATSETGLWAGCALRCWDLTGRSVFLDLATEAMRTWLKAVWDPEAGMFLGRIDVRTGQADRSAKTTPYQPGEYSDPWEPLFPAHDYPLQAADACLRLAVLTGEAVFREAVEHWLQHFAKTLPARHGLGGYAEHDGRMLHWLTQVELAGWKQAAPLREMIRQEIAAKLLFQTHLFRSHPGEDRCDAVDGMGFLLWSLLEEDRLQQRPWEPW